MLKAIFDNKYVYFRADGKEFILKRYRNGEWHTMQVGDIMRVADRSYKLIEIKPTEVIVELLPLTNKKEVAK